MAADMALKRLRKEYRDVNSAENSLVRAAPLESNMLECHYVIQGPPGTPYSGGWYHGKLIFPREYPMKPPAVLMVTPSGRFEINTKICLSLSDFHPESWNPMWSVQTILVGLQSFMQEEHRTAGSIVTTDSVKRKHAAESLKINCKNKIFCDLFPELVELYDKNIAKKASSCGENSSDSAPIKAPANATENTDSEITDIVIGAAVCVLIAVVATYCYYQCFPDAPPS